MNQDTDCKNNENVFHKGHKSIRICCTEDEYERIMSDN